MLKLQYFGNLMQKAHSLEKTQMLGRIEDKWRRGRQRMRWLYSIPHSMDMNLSKLQETLEDRGVGRAAVHGSHRVRHDLAMEQEQQRGHTDHPWSNVGRLPML